MVKNILQKYEYDHTAVLRLCDAVIKNAGSQFDAVYLLSAYLQQAMNPSLFKNIIKVCEMSDSEFDNYWINETTGNQNGI